MIHVSAVSLFSHLLPMAVSEWFYGGFRRMIEPAASQISTGRSHPPHVISVPDDCRINCSATSVTGRCHQLRV